MSTNNSISKQSDVIPSSIQNEGNYVPIIAKRLCELVSEKYNIDIKILKNFQQKLEEIEIKNKKLNSDLIKSLSFRNTLVKYKIHDIKTEFIDALTKPDYLDKKLNNLEDITFIPISDLKPNTDETKLKIELLELCYKLMNYKDYCLDKLSSKRIDDLVFKSNTIEGVYDEILKLNENQLQIYKRIVLAHTGYKLSEFINTFELNYCNAFIKNKLLRITTCENNSASLKHYKTFLDGINHKQKYDEDKYYHNFVVKLTNFHKRISDWKQNLTIISKKELSGEIKSNAFSQNLLDYSHAFNTSIENILDKNNARYYMGNDICHRVNSYYRRLTFDIDVNNNTFDLQEFNQDIKFLFSMVFNKFSDIKVYFAVDISDRIDSNLVIDCINDNKNKYSSELPIDVKYWILNMKKDVSIHIYVVGAYFTEHTLFGMSRKIDELVKSKYLFYIDAAPYHTKTQQFRAPYSGKLIDNREPILRNKIYSNEELIEFYKNCTPFPDIQIDKYAHEFDGFYSLSLEKNKNTYKESTKTKKVFELRKDARPIECKVDLEDSSLYEDVIIDKFNGEEILISMMCEIINKTYGYNEHRRLRMIFINNMLSMGYNIATIRKFNDSFGINHTDGSNTNNAQSNDDITFLQKESTYKFNESLLYKDGKPITFVFKDEWRNILFRKVLSHSILKIIVKHIFVIIGGKQMYYLDDQYNYVSKRNEPTIMGPFESSTQFGKYSFKLFNGEDIVSVSPYDFVTLNDYYYDYKSIGFYDAPRNYNSFIYNTNMKKIHKNFDELFNQVPELKILMEYITFNSEYDQIEQELRIEYIMKSIAYSVQHPGELKQKALILITPQGSGKTCLFNLLADVFIGYVLKDRSLQMILDDSFRNYLMNKVIVCCEEIENNVNINKLKDFITQTSTQINLKNRDAISVPNTSFKLFATNNKQFDFINEQERRFVIFESDRFYGNEVDKPYSKLLDNQEYRNKCVDIIRNYLLTFDLGNFNLNSDKFIPISCKEIKKATAENNSMKSNYDNLFIKCLFENCVTAMKGQYKIMNYNHLIHVIGITLRNVKDSLHYDNLSEEEQIHYKNKTCYENLFEFVDSHYDLDKQVKWNNNKIARVLANDQNFDIKLRPQKNTLTIPKIYEEFYQGRPRVIKYLLIQE